MHDFVYPCFTETTQDAIEACEAAWEFFGGVFKALRPQLLRSQCTCLAVQRVTFGR